MSFLWEKSGIWRWVVVNGKHSKSFFMAFTSLCLVGSWALGEAVMRTTNSSQTQLDAELRKRGRSDPMLMGRVNKERLGQLLGEIQRKENTEDRYSAALRGETLTKLSTPDARVRGGADAGMPATTAAATAATSPSSSSSSPSSSSSSPSSSPPPETIVIALQTGAAASESQVPATTTTAS